MDGFRIYDNHLNILGFEILIFGKKSWRVKVVNWSGFHTDDDVPVVLDGMIKA